MNAQTFANITIPSPRNPDEQTTPVAEVTRQRLAAKTSTSELQRRLAATRNGAVAA